MPENVLKLAESEYPLWNEFVRLSPQGSFFCTTEWANIISFTFNRPFEIIASVQNDQIESGCLVFRQSKMAFQLITPQAFCPYNGPILATVTEAKYQKTIARNLRLITAITEFLNSNYDLWILNTSPQFDDTRAFQWQGCRADPSYTYRLDLTDWQICEENFSQTVRKKVRQAGEQNIKIVQTGDRQRFIEMYSRSYKRHGSSPLVNEKQLDKFLNMALKLPGLKLYYARQDDNPVAGRIILDDDHYIFDLLAGSNDPSGLGSTFLVYSILEEYAGSNRMFDFLGADHPMIEEFKRGFGGKLAASYRVSGPVKFPLSWLHSLRTKQLLRSRTL